MDVTSDGSKVQCYKEQHCIGTWNGNTLAVELPPQARGTGTLIPSVRRLVWAGKHQLGNAAWSASFPSERALPAGGFGSVHTPSP